tara:strand:- start:4033 stop:4659 length:627 start_codon:yes stop_codon:yes gene_type:complete
MIIGESKHCDMQQGYDMVLSNPPFGKATVAQLPEPSLWCHKLSSKDGSCKPVKLLKSAALELLFFEHCIEKLNDGGLCSILLPDGILSNASYSEHRKYFMESNRLLASISLPRETFLHGNTGVKTSVICFEKGEVNISSSENALIFMAQIGDIGWDSRLRPTGGEDVTTVTCAFKEFIQGQSEKNNAEVLFADEDEHEEELPLLLFRF